MPTDEAPPRIAPLFAEAAGKRLFAAAPGSTVVVRARPAGGERLRYKWLLGPDSGTLDKDTGRIVRWTLGTKAGIQELRLIAFDGRGRIERGRLRLPSGKGLVFSGTVVTADGEPIKAAEADVNGETTTTDETGAFVLQIGKTDVPRFVLNIRKPGFALLSQVYDTAVQDGRWALRRATTQTLDPTQAIGVRDTRSQPECQGSLSGRVDWSKYPRQRIARVFDQNGLPLTGPVPGEVAAALALLAQGTPCSPGFAVNIPANALQDAEGRPPRGKIDISVSTVDLYAPNSMPGDYTVETKEGPRVMQSYGAGTVTVTAGTTAYQLKPNADAELILPVDPTQLKAKGSIPPSIPLLLYDEASATWREDGTAVLNEARDAYVAKVKHLSTFNTDLIKVDQSCVRIDSSGITGDYTLEASIPLPDAAPVVKSRDIDNTPETLHTIYNLPSDTWIALVPFKQDTGTVPPTVIPLGTFVVNTGPPQVPTDPNRPDYPYGACQSEIALTEVVGPIALTVDGTGDNIGSFPQFPYVMIDTAETDHYPVGPGTFYTFGLFDTGADIVRISQATAGPFNMGGASPTNPAQDLHLRLNGMAAINPADFGAPIGPPGFAESQAEVENIRVGIRPESPDLIGAPVTNEVAALIDYATIVTRGPYGPPINGNVDGPDMTFFNAGDPDIPVPVLKLQLERFGTTTPALTDNASRGRRLFLRNLSFENGANAVTDDQTAAVPFNFMFDTAANVTIINVDMAVALGIDPAANGTFDCFSGSVAEGHTIDRIVMSGLDPDFLGTFTVENASVCVDVLDDKIITVFPDPDLGGMPRKVDAVIGSNLFLNGPILVDSPAGALGIMP